MHALYLRAEDNGVGDALALDGCGRGKTRPDTP